MSKNPDFLQSDNLAVKYLPAVRATAYKLILRLPNTVDIQDLISIGSEALVGSLKKYEPSKNVSFWGFCKIRVEGAMLDYLRSLDTHSRPKRKLAKAIAAYQEKFYKRNGFEPSDLDISKELSVSLEEIRELRLIGHEVASAFDIEATDATTPDILDALEQERKIDTVMKVLSAYSDMEQRMVISFYVYEMKLQDIAQEHSVSVSRVCQIVKGTIKKLQHSLKNIEL